MERIEECPSRPCVAGDEAFGSFNGHFGPAVRVGVVRRGDPVVDPPCG